MFRNIFFVSALTLCSTVYAYGWTAPVVGLEVEFPCNGMKPDFSAQPGVNIEVSNGEVVRVKDTENIVADKSGNISFQTSPGQRLLLGKFTEVAPACSIDEGGHPAESHWAGVIPSANAQLSLEFNPQPQTCNRDNTDGSLSRVDIYTLNIEHISTHQVYSLMWTENNRIQTKDDCLNGRP